MRLYNFYILTALMYRRLSREQILERGTQLGTVARPN